jgi:hypothetical protein
MIDVKEAVQKALLFVREVMQDSRANSVLLEEIELSDDGSEWLVTISVPSPKAAGIGSLMSGGQAEARDYKLIRINASTGNAESLKIRDLSAVSS